MAYIEVDIDIEDHLDEVEDKYLIKELKSRNYRVGDPVRSEYETPLEQLVILKELLGLKAWHDNKRVLREVTELLEIGI